MKATFTKLGKIAKEIEVSFLANFTGFSKDQVRLALLKSEEMEKLNRQRLEEFSQAELKKRETSGFKER